MKINLIPTIKYFSFLTVCKFTCIYGYIQYKSNTDNSKKINIVFDLDETLLFTDKIKNYNQYNRYNLAKPDYTDVSGRNIWIRPWVKELLPVLYKFNNIYVFTKATQGYADLILEKTNLNQYLREKKYRPDCENTCKDITKFMLECHDSLLVDDKISNQCTGHNFYHIPRFNYYVKNDFEFVKLFYYIIWLNLKNDFGKKN